MKPHFLHEALRRVIFDFLIENQDNPFTELKPRALHRKSNEQRPQSIDPSRSDFAQVQNGRGPKRGPTKSILFFWGGGEGGKCIMHRNALWRRVRDSRRLAVGPIRPLDNLPPVLPTTKSTLIQFERTERTG